MEKRLMAFLLALVMLFGTTAMGEEFVAVENEPSVQEVQPTGVQQGTELVVGSTTPTSGYFFSNMWGYNTSDMDVRLLIHGYGTLAWTRDLNYTLDESVLQDIQTEITPEGGKRYVFTLKPGLTYNDGMPVTAKDYVFSILLHSAPQVKTIGANITTYSHLRGYSAFAGGASQVFSGVRLLSENQFSMEIAKEYLRYFYELAYVDVLPAPTHVIVPGCQVADDGQGAYMKGYFTTELLRRTLLDSATGYAFHPKVTCGPYQLESYDRISHEANFVVNAAYQGNHEGVKPRIERIRLTPVTNQNMVSKLQNGEVGLVNKVGEVDNITAMLEDTRQGRYRAMNYMRSGYAFVAFACENGPTASAKVRQALARLIDQDAMTTAFAGDYGLRVHACYGLGQWMTLYRDEELDVLEELKKLPDYAPDMGQAVRLLKEDGWIYDENGQPYVEGSGEVRHQKDENGNLIALELRWAMSQDNKGANAIQEQIKEPFAQVGVGLKVTVMPFEDMLVQYYRHEDRQFNMFYLASNFTYVFDPYPLYHTGDEYQGTSNVSGLRDEELMRLALEMRQTTPGDNLEYCRRWLKFQQRWAEVLPAVPLYSNVYFDFFRNDLMEYQIGSFSSWALAMQYAYIQEQTVP